MVRRVSKIPSWEKDERKKENENKKRVPATNKGNQER
jgi:hypothetical protein